MENSSQLNEKNNFVNQFFNRGNNHHNNFKQTPNEQDTVNMTFVENPENCILSGESMPVFETISLVSSSDSEIENSSQVAGTGSSPTDTEIGSYAADDEKSNSDISPTYTEDDSSAFVRESVCNVANSVISCSVESNLSYASEEEDESRMSADKNSSQQDLKQSSLERESEKEKPIIVDNDDDSSSPLIGRKKKKQNIFNDTESDDGLQNSTAEEASIDGEEDENEEEDSDNENSNTNVSKSNRFVSDFDRMLQKKRSERQRSRKRNSEFITENDDLIDQLIDSMEYAAYSDRRLNAKGKPAIKKISMLKYVMTQLIKKDLQAQFLEHNILGTLTEWLSPLPTRCLPCLPIRENILRLLEDFPPIDSRLLKYSGIGKAIMFLRDNPNETKDNRERCSQLVMKWARPLHDLSCDYKTMSKEERQRRDYEMSLQYRKQKENATSSAKKIKIDSLDQALSNRTECEAIGPGDPRWVPRARVPQPSTRDYIRRPKSQLQCETSTITKPNRYEVMAKKYLKAQRGLKMQRSGVSLSILGRKM